MNEYKNKEEDKKAFNLIFSEPMSTVEQLMSRLKEQNLPFRDKYFYYFSGIAHQKNKSIGFDNNLNDELLTDLERHYTWWEHYLKYEVAIKSKIRADKKPSLLKLKYVETLDCSFLEKYHSDFIEQGYKYIEQIDKSIIEDMSNYFGEQSNYDGPSMIDIMDELKEIEKEYDTGRFVHMKSRITPVFEEYCNMCQQTPCMCSDPY